MASIPFNEIPIINPDTLSGPETFPIESGGITFRTSVKDVLNIKQSIPGTSIKSLSIDSTHLKPNSVAGNNIIDNSIDNSHIKGRTIVGPLVALKTLSAEHIVPDASFVLDKSITAKKLSGVSKIRPGGLDSRNGFPESGTAVLSTIPDNSAPVFGVRAWGMLEFMNTTSSGSLKYVVSLKAGGNVANVYTTGWTTTGGWATYKVIFEHKMPTPYYSITFGNGPFTNGDHENTVMYQDENGFYFISMDGNKIQKNTVNSYPTGLYEGKHAPYYSSTGEYEVGIPLAKWTLPGNTESTQGWGKQKISWYKASDIKSVYGSANNIDTAGTGTGQRVTNSKSSFVYFNVVC